MTQDDKGIYGFMGYGLPCTPAYRLLLSTTFNRCLFYLYMRLLSKHLAGIEYTLHDTRRLISTFNEQFVFKFLFLSARESRPNVLEAVVCRSDFTPWRI